MIISAKLRFLPPIIVTYTLISLLICLGLYFISTPNPIQPRLPPLSEIGIYIPARYVFTMTMLVLSAAIIVLSVLVFVVVNESIKTKMKISDSQPSDRAINITLGLNAIRCGLLFLSAMCLAGMGTVPLQDATPGPQWFSSIQYVVLAFHVAFIVGFMGSFYLHMILSTIVAIIYTRHTKMTKTWHWYKLAITLISLVCPMISVGLYFLYSTCNSNACQILLGFLAPLNQYLAVFLFAMFLLSYSYEFYEYECSMSEIPDPMLIHNTLEEYTTEAFTLQDDFDNENHDK